MCLKATFCLSETKCTILWVHYARVGVFSLQIVHGCMLFFIIVLQHGKKSTVHGDPRRIFWRLAEFIIITNFIFAILPKTRV